MKFISFTLVSFFALSPYCYGFEEDKISSLIAEIEEFRESGCTNSEITEQIGENVRFINGSLTRDSSNLLEDQVILREALSGFRAATLGVFTGDTSNCEIDTKKSIEELYHLLK